jgi:hypothetical protein
MRFIWLPCHNGDSRQETIDSEVDPRQSNTEGFAGFDESGESGKVKYRAVCGYHVNTFIKLHESEQNRSLGLIVNERPVSYFRGNVALAASSLTSEDVDADPVPIDALPCDLPKLLQCLAREESANGSEVKMELTFFDYSESGEQVELSEKQFHERNQEQFEQFRQQNPEQLEQFEQLCRQQ